MSKYDQTEVRKLAKECVRKNRPALRIQYLKFESIELKNGVWECELYSTQKKIITKHKRIYHVKIDDKSGNCVYFK